MEFRWEIFYKRASGEILRSIIDIVQLVLEFWYGIENKLVKLRSRLFYFVKRSFCNDVAISN